MRVNVIAFLSGALFAAGLVLGGMTRPGKVIGFLDVAGDWDPSLAFVMAGAVGVNVVLFRVILRRPHPLFATAFRLPTKKDIDARLVVGASLFGVGWGLAGYCPGPAVTALGTLALPALTLVGGMALGMALFALFDRLRS